MRVAQQQLFDRMVLVATMLTAFVVVLGAYVRLSDAGLGCPDWPGCYGHMMVPHGDQAMLAYPGKPLEVHKAWLEMVHRYFAGALGLMILSISIIAWRGRGRLAGSPVLPTVLLGLVLMQALLGMWTVTLLLKPAIVSAHLLGGMATLALLAWMAQKCHATELVSPAAVAIRPWAALALAVLAGQIFLGGWTSSNYAALACTDFPSCQGVWLPDMDFAQAFHMVRELGENAEGSQLSSAALTAIHWAHRFGALITFLYLGWFSWRLLRTHGLQRLGGMVLASLLVQICLGIANVLYALPLALAVGHNAGAALLLVLLVMVMSRISGATNSGRVGS